MGVSSLSRLLPRTLEQSNKYGAMKKSMFNGIRQIFLLIFLSAVNFSVFGYDEKIDGIYYDLNEENLTVSVASGGYKYSGEVVIPSEVTYNGKVYSVTSIGEWAFDECTGLTSIDIPNSVTSIGVGAFYGCTGLTSIDIPNSVTSIGVGAFYGCTGLTSIEIPNSVTSISDKAFCRCTGLTSIELSNSVTSIGEKTFYGCTGLTSIELPNSVTSIGEGAFEECTGLTSIEIPNSVTSIGYKAFYGCTELSELIIADGEESLILIMERDYNWISIFPFTGDPLSYIYMGRNIDCSSSPFEELSSFKVTVGTLVTSIESNAFRGCPGLTAIDLPNSVTSIGEYTFWGCTGLTSIEIPNSVTSIGLYAFNGCTGLTSIDIPNSVTSIGDRAFDGCSGLTSIEIPNSVTSIGLYAFNGCTGLTSINIPNSVSSIGANAFERCSSLTRAEFASIESLCKISFESYSSNPLYYTHNLYIDGTEITKLLIPDTVESIGKYAFSRCSGLTSLELSSSVTTIGSSAFSGCNGLTSLELPSSVTTIGSSAFSGCNGLKDVYYATTRPTNDASENIFDNSTYSSATLWVPQEAVELCQRISPWRNFYDIKPYDFATGVEDIVFSPEDRYEDDVKELTEVFTLDGAKVSETQENLSPGVYVIRKGSETKKIVVK